MYGGVVRIAGVVEWSDEMRGSFVNGSVAGYSGKLMDGS